MYFLLLLFSLLIFPFTTYLPPQSFSLSLTLLPHPFSLSLISCWPSISWLSPNILCARAGSPLRVHAHRRHVCPSKDEPDVMPTSKKSEQEE